MKSRALCVITRGCMCEFARGRAGSFSEWLRGQNKSSVDPLHSASSSVAFFFSNPECRTKYLLMSAFDCIYHSQRRYSMRMVNSSLFCGLCYFVWLRKCLNGIRNLGSMISPFPDNVPIGRVEERKARENREH